MSRNIRFIQAAISVVKSTRISPYSCKYSKKTFTQHQLLVLILFKDYRNQHFREFVEDVGGFSLSPPVLFIPFIYSKVN